VTVTIRLLLVDDQPMLRMGFRMIFESQSDMQVVGEAGDGEEAIYRLRITPADVVLMDVRMPHVDGVAATHRIVTEIPDPPRVLILTTFDLDEYVYAGLQAGASGFLLKDVPPEQLLHAIRVVAAGDAVVAPSVTRRLLDRFARQLPAPEADNAKIDSLTEREREVLLEVATGRSNAEIAQRLFLSEATVKTHVAHMLAKLDVRDRVQAVVYAYETGLVTRQAST
jgi:DNA-binding NarL/FixJ family response regulator